LRDYSFTVVFEIEILVEYVVNYHASRITNNSGVKIPYITKLGEGVEE
jgi:hypothetical protein